MRFVTVADTVHYEIVGGLQSLYGGGDMKSYDAPEHACPYCTSLKIQPTASRSFEAESHLTWYECLVCKRPWNRVGVPINTGSEGRRRSAHWPPYGLAD